MAIGQICNKKIVTIDKGASILQAAKVMKSQHVGDVVVVDDSSGLTKPIGMLTDRDIVRFVVSEDAVPSALCVEDIMAKPLQLVKESAGVFETIQLMRKAGVRRLPVIAESGALMGLISVDDLLILLATELQGLSSISRVQIRIERDSESALERFQAETLN